MRRSGNSYEMKGVDYCVYKHTAPNGKVYIGITRQNPQRRWRPDGSGYRENRHFWNAICCYGWDNIQHEIVAKDLTKEEACAMEISLIAEYDAMNPDKGYNNTAGGEYPPFTEATRKKLSDAMKSRNWVGERNPNYGHHKLAGKNNPNYGKVYTPEERALISEHRKGKGKVKRSEETKRLIREHHAGGADSKKVVCIETGEVFESINAAAKFAKAHKGRISGCCRNLDHYNTAGGFHWKFT